MIAKILAVILPILFKFFYDEIKVAIDDFEAKKAAEAEEKKRTDAIAHEAQAAKSPEDRDRAASDTIRNF